MGNAEDVLRSRDSGEHRGSRTGLRFSDRENSRWRLCRRRQNDADGARVRYGTDHSRGCAPEDCVAPAGGNGESAYRVGSSLDSADDFRRWSPETRIGIADTLWPQPNPQAAAVFGDAADR